MANNRGRHVGLGDLNTNELDSDEGFILKHESVRRLSLANVVETQGWIQPICSWLLLVLYRPKHKRQHKPKASTKSSVCEGAVMSDYLILQIISATQKILLVEREGRIFCKYHLGETRHWCISTFKNLPSIRDVLSRLWLAVYYRFLFYIKISMYTIFFKLAKMGNWPLSFPLPADDFD